MYAVSIILVNYQNPVLTKNCILSIKETYPKVDYEIVVVDNDSKDDSVEFLRRAFPDIKVISSGKNGGFAYGNNYGIQSAEGEYLLLLNNDTIVYPGMIDALYEFSNNNPQVGLIGCRSIDRNSEELPVAHTYETLPRILLQSYIKPIFEMLHIQRKIVSISHKQNFDSFRKAQWIAGSALFTSKNLYFKMGGLDENFFMYMEDEDICRRYNSAGYEVGILPFVGYQHFCGGSTIQSYFLTKEYIKSRLVFFMRYEPKLFKAYRLVLFAQISSINRAISRKEKKQMKKELDSFIENELMDKAQNVRGI